MQFRIRPSRSLHPIIPTLFLSVVTTASYAGSRSSGGADAAFPDSGAAWFLESTDGTPRDISVCFEGDLTAYGDGPQASLNEAFNSWQHYIMQRAGRRLRPQGFLPSFGLNFLIGPCDNADLTIKLGGESEEINQIRGHFERPISFAYRQTYDLEKGWGKGFIWIAAPSQTDPEVHPDLRQKGILRMLIKHEVGHVFGIGHIENTIMDQQIVRSLKSAGANPWYLESIDWGRQVLICDGCEDRSHFQPTKAAFQKLVGRDPEGSFVGHLKSTQSGAHILILDDKREGVEEFPFARPNGRDSYFRAAEGILKAVRSTEGQIDILSHPFSGQVIYGYFRLKDGREQAASMELNSWSMTPYQFQLIDGGWTTPVVH
jgi:hypothetical protein